MNFNILLSPYARVTSYVVLTVYTKSWKHCLFTLVAHSNLDHTFQVCGSLLQRVAVVLVQGEKSVSSLDTAVARVWKDNCRDR